MTNQDGGGFEDEGTLDYEKQNFLTNQDGEGLKMREEKRQTLDGVGVRDAEWRAPPRSPFPD